ncbi:HPr family phosphocarrier protein [Priestia endophytica]|jgi:catabolite repression HPr-like protein|uniref:Phosphocarrier protein n=1 Tax=Priestia endophytica DSM 13796 TaxID=1121089 RepID=A0A1I6BAK9_9BACI|nr:HPr family phosphocarrier protein [Priestia endophytica]KYG26121.1 aldolase [Priestia endophytica]MBG9813745.1 aldolase [Priestia endophytica]RAS73140.1 HPr family phosphocarrier protein [Priestia endophytica]SFQ77973.1 phosphocarrier protein [Priestia endophytica DSM 13796]
MLMKKLIVKLPRGLQARHTALFVRKVTAFESKIILSKDGKTAGGKDIMRIMDLVVKEGDEITLLVDGCDEQVAMEALEVYLLNVS